MTELKDIQCDACGQIGYYEYTTDYLGTGEAGYYCTLCYYYYTAEEFAIAFPDYDQTGHTKVV